MLGRALSRLADVGPTGLAHCGSQCGVSDRAPVVHTLAGKERVWSGGPVPRCVSCSLPRSRRQRLSSCALLWPARQSSAPSTIGERSRTRYTWLRDTLPDASRCRGVRADALRSIAVAEGGGGADGAEWRREEAGDRAHGSALAADGAQVEGCRSALGRRRQRPRRGRVGGDDAGASGSLGAEFRAPRAASWSGSTGMGASGRHFSRQARVGWTLGAQRSRHATQRQAQTGCAINHGCPLVRSLGGLSAISCGR